MTSNLFIDYDLNLGFKYLLDNGSSDSLLLTLMEIINGS